jgi:hypothetical protein
MLPQILTVNPMAKRRRKRTKNPHARRHRARNPFRHTSRRRHHAGRRSRNPFDTKGLMDALIPAAIGGAGAVGVDILLAYLPLPASLQTGWGNYAAKIAGSFAVGYAGGMALGRDKGHQITAGALTVTAYTIVKSLAAQSLGTTVKGLSGLADFRDYRRSAMGAYMDPAAVVRSQMPGPMRASTAITARPQSRAMGAYMQRQRTVGAYMRNRSSMG